MTARKLQFTGALFDGKSSKKHLVDVELTPQEIILKTSDFESVRWAYSDLRWTAETSPYHIEHSVGDENGGCLETLVVEDIDFYENILKIAPKNFSSTGEGLNFNWKIYTVGILVLMFFAYVLIKNIPSFLVDQMVDKVPIEWEVTVGQSILNMLPIEKEPDKEVITILQDTVNLLGKFVEGNQPYDLKVYLLPVKQANALALPGGPIVIFEGLLHESDSPEELAGVLAHEIQHILLRHSTRGILQNLANSMLVALFLGDVNSVMEGIVQLTGELETLGLSREMEAEADKKGMELILSANIDPNGMIRIFEKLTQEDLVQTSPSEKTAVSTENDIKLSSYFSTHPSGQNRLAQLEKQMKSHENRNWEPLFPNVDWNKIKH
jgi:beta-barrel assembly-enhancing protease